MASVVVDFQYGRPANPGALVADRRGHSALTVSIFADRAYLRAELADDASAAGLSIAHASGLDLLHSGSDTIARPEWRNDDHVTGDIVLGDIVLVDCPLAEDLQRIDLVQFGRRAARCGAQLVVSTSMDALDHVFGCLDQGAAQILVAPDRAERMIALGRALPLAANRVQELSEIDRIALLRLTEQVAQIAQQLGQISGTPGKVPGPDTRKGGAFRFEGSSNGNCGTSPRGEDGSERLVRTLRPPLPDPRLVRRIVRHRQLRARYFDGELFADPAWDILLDLTAARAEHTRVSVSSLCIAAGVPTSTALRWIGQLIDTGLLQRNEDEADRRRAFITLTDKAADAVARYFAEMGPAAAALV